jgi:hypothetical protein
VLLLSVGRREILPFLFFTESPGRKCKESNSKRRGSRGLVLSKFPPLWGFLVCYHFDTVSYTAAYNTENKSSSSYVRERGRKTIPQAPSVGKKKGEIESNVNNSSSNKKMKIQLNWTNRKKEEEEMARVKLN